MEKMYNSIIRIILLLFISINYTVSLICYTVHWDAYSSFTERVHRCNNEEEFCASLVLLSFFWFENSLLNKC